MKKIFFVSALCTLITFQSIVAKVFSEALSDFVKSEQELLALYSKADAKERPALKRQMLRAGIAPEQIDAAEPTKSTTPIAQSAVSTEQETTMGTNPDLLQARKNLKPIPAPAPKAPSSTEIAEKQLQDARAGLRKTTPNAPKTFAPLPGKPTEKELQDALAERARKRELQQ